MMRVHLAPEPDAFDEKVRQPGRPALDRLAVQKYSGSKEAIPASEFPPCWRKSIDDLLAAYNRICSYLCLYIPRATGARSVDHMIPKSLAWDRAYEWDNYRLACSLMNARKGAATSVLDPFEVEDGWFALELVEFQVLPADGLPDPTATAVDDTIRRLRLNDKECRDAREEFAVDYWCEKVRFDYVKRHAPFVASELRRHNRVGPADLQFC